MYYSLAIQSIFGFKFPIFLRSSKFSGKKWSQVKATVKMYLNAVLQVCLSSVNIYYWFDLDHRILHVTVFTYWSINVVFNPFPLFLLQVLRKLSDPAMLCVVLRHTQSLGPFYAMFPKITRHYVKVIHTAFLLTSYLLACLALVINMHF